MTKSCSPSTPSTRVDASSRHGLPSRTATGDNRTMRFGLLLLIAACRSTSQTVEPVDAASPEQSVAHGRAPRWLLEVFGAQLPDPPGSPPLPPTTYKESVRRTIRSHFPDLVRCYKAVPNLQIADSNRSVFHFTISPDGKTRDVAIETQWDPRLAECWRRSIVEWRFEHPHDGRDYHVDYPWSPDISGP